MSSLWSRLLGRQQYNLLPTTNDPPQNLPGSFPAETASPETGNQSIRTLILEWLIFLIIKPITFAAVFVLALFSRFISFLYFDSIDIRRLRSASETATTSCNAFMNDPISKVESFVRALEENLLPEQQYYSQNYENNVLSLPPFFHGSYTQALYMAINRGKFLYVYLTNPSNESSSSIFDRIITNPKFISIFTTENRNNQNIIWGGDLTNLEAYQLANSLNVTKFPFLGLLCLTRTSTMTPQGPSKTPPKISLILKIQGGISDDQDPNKVIQSKFIKRTLKYEPELSLIRAELKEKYMAELVRKQQNADYQQSLLKDKQKKAQKERKKLAADYLRWKQLHIQKLRLQQADRQHMAKIAIKMAGGNRETFYFPEDSPIEDIYLYVELHQKSLIDEEANFTATGREAEKFKDFEYPYQFRLVSPVPPLPLLNDYDKSTKVKDVSFIYPSGLLMVERL